MRTQQPMRLLRRVRPIGLVARGADVLMAPVMRALSGAPEEAPQRTHFWNNQRLGPAEVEAALDWRIMVRRHGDPAAVQRSHPFSVRFHLPCFGGWKRYVVLCPINEYGESYQGAWHVGWWNEQYAGISRLAIRGMVRMLIGPSDIRFFGIRAEGDQMQLHLRYRGEGVIGDGSQFNTIQLL